MTYELWCSRARWWAANEENVHEYNHTDEERRSEEKAEVSYLTAQEPLAWFQTQTSSWIRTMDAGEARF